VKFSRGLAIIAGVFLPVLETWRRWDQLGDIRMAPAWLDDWIIGVFLLYGAWRTRNNDRSGRAVLAAAWGFACGMAYSSFFMQVARLGEADPSGISSVNVVVFKGVMMALAVAALVVTLRSNDSN
jgi:hypothetical protein